MDAAERLVRLASLYAELASYDQMDWPQLLVLCGRLLGAWPSPLVALNRTVPLAIVPGRRSRTSGSNETSAWRDTTTSRTTYLPAINERAFLEEQIRGGAL